MVNNEKNIAIFFCNPCMKTGWLVLIDSVGLSQAPVSKNQRDTSNTSIHKWGRTIVKISLPSVSNKNCEFKVHEIRQLYMEKTWVEHGHATDRWKSATNNTSIDFSYLLTESANVLYSIEYYIVTSSFFAGTFLREWFESHAACSPRKRTQAAMTDHVMKMITTKRLFSRWARPGCIWTAADGCAQVLHWTILGLSHVVGAFKYDWFDS